MPNEDDRRSTAANGPVLVRVSYRAGVGASAEVMVLSGELDAASAPVLEPVLEAFTLGGRGDVRLDLAGVRFVDVAGVRLLERTARRLRIRDACLILERPHAAVTRLLELIGPHIDGAGWLIESAAPVVIESIPPESPVVTSLWPQHSDRVDQRRVSCGAGCVVGPLR
jgi:anti-anti-sigma factor